ncbi:hypothetical protein [Streptomyces aureus]|uniref:hypothetical protein n=1 Tax=Streptomyces aureus TaxID=193461 RepID=UPI00131E24C3|nr:hypothetical protein [Streptomyces aureus]
MSTQAAVVERPDLFEVSVLDVDLACPEAHSEERVFKGVSGQRRAVAGPAVWTIYDARSGPNQQITRFPVVFEVVKVRESCAHVTPGRCEKRLALCSGAVASVL